MDSLTTGDKCGLDLRRATCQRTGDTSMACGSGRKLLRSSDPSEDRPRTKFEAVLAFSVLIPVVAGAVLGAYLFSWLGLEKQPLPEDWNGWQVKGLIRQVTWLLTAAGLVKLYGVLLRVAGIVSKEQEQRFPFGVRFGG